MTKYFIHTTATLTVLMLLLFTHPARAQNSLTDMIGGIKDLASEYEIDTSLIRAPTPEEWQQFWRTAQTTLQSESLADLADFLPYAEMALAYLERAPEARPYADWLRQRMDYFSVADEIVKEERKAPGQPPVQPPKKPVSITPPSQPAKPAAVTPPPVVPPPVSSTKKSMDMDRWTKKLEGRPPPKLSAQYVPILKPIFRQSGVPDQLVWLAEVESSFDPQAKSPVGALGLYQFMPATAERFGLSLKPKDERMIPERSATAASKYLKFLHGRFGSWPLALAAYNAGEGRVGKLLTKHSANSFEGIADFLPAETRMYVPKISAVIKLREGVDLSHL